MSYRHEGLPYYSQWESRDIVGSLVRSEATAKDDPLWRNSGAKDIQEYELWSKNICGMACLKMILEHQTGQEYPLVELGKKCLEYGGYVLNGNELDGLYYKPFLDFVKREFNLEGMILSPMRQEDILEQLTDKNYVIVSVNKQIRHPEVDFHGKKGGHLVLVAGSDLESETFFIHNPSGDSRESQEFAPISFKNFESFFAQRGIVIFNEKAKGGREVS